MQIIEEFDKHSKGSEHKRKELEDRLQETIDEDEQERNKTGTDGMQAKSQSDAAAKTPTEGVGSATKPESPRRPVKLTAAASRQGAEPLDIAVQQRIATSEAWHRASAYMSYAPPRGAAHHRTRIGATRVRPRMHQICEIRPKLHQAGLGNANPKSNV